MTVRTRSQLDGLIDSLFPSDGDPRITAAELRTWLQDILDSITLASEEDSETLQATLAAIMEGTGVTIDRTTNGEIEVSASGGGGLADGVADSVALTLASNGTDVTVTLGRSAGLADLTDTLTLALITDDEAHQLSQIPGLEDKTQDLAVENSYTWADSEDGDIAIRSDAPPTPWLASTIWDDERTIVNADISGGDDYLVLRIGINADVTEFRVQITRGSNEFAYNGSAFRRIHKTQTSHAFYAHPNSVFKAGDVLQVQKGTVTGEVTEYRGHVGGAKVDASGFDGNLSTTDDTLQEIAQAVDDLSVGGGGAASVVAYSAPLADIAATAYATAIQILDLGTPTVNEGAFTVDTTGTADRLVIPEDGFYLLIASVYVESTDRTVGTIQFTLDNGVDAEAAIAGQGTGYARGIATEDFIIAEHSHIVELSDGDLIGLTLLSSDTGEDLEIVGASSSLEAIKLGGAKGDKGDAGPGGGAAITSGTADPSGGAAGDAYIQVDASSVIQSLWRNIAGTWTEFTIPTGGGFTLRTGSAAPGTALGESGDWYLRTSNGQFYEKVSTTWHGRYTSVGLSDADPEPTGTASAGTATAAARADHVHAGLALSDDAPEDVGTAAAGTSTDAARSDHVHGGGTGGGVTLSDDDPEDVGTTAAPGTSTEAARADHVHVGGTGSGTVVTASPVSGDGSAADPVTVENQAISHLKIGSTVAGVDQAAGRILEADGAGDVRWADQSGGTEGGTDDQTAAEVTADTTNFDGNLSSSDSSVQAALETIDDFELENTFRGAYNSNRTYDGGEMVIYQGLEYISLIRENDREPTRSEEQWSAQPRGYIYRGDAPVAATTYQESHIVRVPAQDSYYICTFQGGVSVTRAQIAAGHANFNPLAHRLTDAQVASSTSSEKGTISGEQLHDFAPELGIAEATSKVFRRVRPGIRASHRGGHRRTRGALDERDHGHRRGLGHRDQCGAVP